MFWFLVILLVVGWIIKASSKEQGDSANKIGNLIHMVVLIIVIFIVVVSCLDACMM